MAQQIIDRGTFPGDGSAEILYSAWGKGNANFTELYGLLPAINVKTHGATGDGVADDTAEIQAAIDAANAAGGGRVYLPNGTYKISSMLTLKPGVMLEMEDPATTITSSDIHHMVKLRENTVLTGGAITNTNVSNTGALIYLNEDFNAGRRDDMAHVSHVRLKGPQAGGGVSDCAILAELTTENNAIQWTRFLHLNLCDTFYGIRLNVTTTSGVLSWINSLVFDSIGLDRHKIPIDISLADPFFGMAAENLFTGILLENGVLASTYPQRRMIKCDGDDNKFDIVAWDWETTGAGIAFEFGVNAAGNVVDVIGPVKGDVLNGSMRNTVNVHSSDVTKLTPPIIPPSAYLVGNQINGVSGGLVDDFLMNGLSRGMTISNYSGPAYPVSYLPRMFQLNNLKVLWGIDQEKSSGHITFEVDLNGTYNGLAAAGILCNSTMPLPVFKLETYYSAAWHTAIDIKNNTHNQCWAPIDYGRGAGVSKIRVTFGGAWQASGYDYEIGEMAYDDVGDGVSGEGRYICVAAHTSGATMAADASSWEYYQWTATSSIGITNLFLLKGDAFGQAWAPSIPNVLVKTGASAAINANEHNSHYTNEGATVASTFNLPAATVGLNYSLSRVASYDMTIAPNGTDIIRGPSVLTSDGDAIQLKCISEGYWEVQSHLQQLNVTHFGAVGDGSTDNLTVIEAAITAANAAGGGTVFFPMDAAGGQYNVSAGFEMKANVRLTMEPGVVLANQDNTPNALLYTVKMVPYSQLVDCQFKHEFSSTAFIGAEIMFDGEAQYPGNDQTSQTPTLIDRVTIETARDPVNTGVGIGAAIHFYAGLPGEYIQMVKVNNVDIRWARFGIKFTAENISNNLDVIFDNVGNTVDVTAHGLLNDSPVQFTTTGTLPAELSEETTYYIVNSTTDDFQISTTLGGSVLEFTDDGTGTHKVDPTPVWINGNTFSNLHMFRCRYGIYIDARDGASNSNSQVNGNMFNNIQFQTGGHSARLLNFDGGVYNSIRNLMCWDWQGLLAGGYDAIKFNQTYNTRHNYVELLGTMDEGQIEGYTSKDTAGAEAAGWHRNTVVFASKIPIPIKQFSYDNLVGGSADALASDFPGSIVYVSNGAAGSPIVAFSDGTNWLRCDTLAAITET